MDGGKDVVLVDTFNAIVCWKLPWTADRLRAADNPAEVQRLGLALGGLPWGQRGEMGSSPTGPMT